MVGNTALFPSSPRRLVSGLLSSPLPKPRQKHRGLDVTPPRLGLLPGMKASLDTEP